VFVNLDVDRTAPPLLEALGTFADECEPYPIEELALTLDGVGGQLQQDLISHDRTWATHSRAHETWRDPLLVGRGSKAVLARPLRHSRDAIRPGR
jgi:hypothetical protein